MLGWFVENTVVAAFLAGLVAIICALARPRPAVRHALWLVVLLKLMVPPLLSWPWTMGDIGHPVLHWLSQDRLLTIETVSPDEAAVSARFDAPIPPGEMKVVFVPVGVPDEMPPADFELNPIHSSVDQSVHQDIAGHPEQVQEIQGAEPISITNVLMKLWLAGAVGMSVCQIWRVVRFRRQLKKAVLPPDRLVGEVAELAALLRIRMPKVAVLPAIASPLVWSLGAARLIWPAELSNRLSEPSRRAVLLHELAHIRRRDHWVGWLQLAGACIHWWNPLFWFVSRQVRENAELACDAWVVDMLPESRRAFAEALIEVAQVMSSKGAPVLALGLGSGRRRDFERRLVMIMSAGVPCKLSLRGLVVVGLLALTALPSWSSGQQEPEKPKAPATPVAVPPPATPEPPPAPSIAEVPPPAFEAAPYSAFAGFSAPTQNDPDARLKAIEQQLQALLKEVQGMRKGGIKAPTPTAGVRYVPAAPATVSAVPPPVGAPFPQRASGSGGTINLTRATYDLPAAKAKALADLLQDSKGPAVEIKVEGDKVTVTTTPEALRIVAQFIAMLQGKAYDARTFYQYQAVPVTTYEAVR